MKYLISLLAIILLCGVIMIGITQLNDPLPVYAMGMCCNNLGSVNACDEFSGSWTLKFKDGYETWVSCSYCEDMWDMGYFDCDDDHNIHGKYWCGSDWECSNPYSSNGCYVGSTAVSCTNYCSDKFYTLWLSTTTGGTTSPSPGTRYRPRNQNTSITANAYSGYDFSHWSGNASGSSNPLSLYMNSNKSVTANFVLEPLVASISGPSYVMVPNKGQSPVTKTWTASATGGQSPYTYTWYRKIGSGGTYYQVGTGSTYSYTYTYVGYDNDRTIYLKVVVVDNNSNSDDAVKSVFEDSYPWDLYKAEASDEIAQNEQKPDNFQLFQNYPNPFNPSTSIRFSLPKAEKISLAIYDQQGRVVRRLIIDYINAGTHEVIWDGRNETNEAVASGIYICVLKGETLTTSKRLALIH